VNGYLDRLPVSAVTRFEAGLLAEVREKGTDILSTIRTEGALSDATREKLKGFLDSFAAKFAA